MKKELAPNLFLIGFPKCATTTLYDILHSHPEVFMARLKKPDYFMFKSLQMGLDASKIIESERERLLVKVSHVNSYQTPALSSYELLFDGAETFKWRGEASHYSNYPQVPLAIQSEGISAKILVCIRNPVERFVSHYEMMVRESQFVGSLKEFFQHCLELELARVQWLYSQRSPLSSGLYGEYISPYVEAFGKDNVLVILFEDLENDYYKTCQTIFRWLHVDTNYRPKFVQRSVGGKYSNNFFQNVDGIMRSEALAPLRSVAPAKIKDCLIKLGRKKTIVSKVDAEMIGEFYSVDILKLQQLIERKVSY